ncbi:hypothetical protein D3C87_1917940 [compost metagenome]
MIASSQWEKRLAANWNSQPSANNIAKVIAAIPARRNGSALCCGCICQSVRIEFCHSTACQRNTIETMMAKRSVVARKGAACFENHGSSR